MMFIMDNACKMLAVIFRVEMSGNVFSATVSSFPMVHSHSQAQSGFILFPVPSVIAIICRCHSRASIS